MTNTKEASYPLVDTDDSLSFSEGKDMKLEIIVWVDSFGCSASWSELSNIEKFEPVHIRSCGWVAYEDECHIVVVPHLSPARPELGMTQQGCGDMTIPQSAIVSRNKIDGFTQ